MPLASKLILSFLVLWLSFMVQRCTTKQPPAACRDGKLEMPAGYKEKKLYTLIFLDYTDKNIIGDLSISKLKNAVYENLISPGDRIDIYLITPNTAVQTTPYTITLAIKERATIKIDSKTDLIAKTRKYACSRLQALDSLTRDLGRMLQKQKAHMDTSQSDNSDIGGLFHIADMAWNNPAFKGCFKTLYIFSDLEHNCPGYFGVTARFSAASNIASGNVDQDFATISGKVNLLNFKGARVSYFLGDSPRQQSFSNAQNSMIRYWEELFKKLGLILINA